MDAYKDQNIDIVDSFNYLVFVVVVLLEKSIDALADKALKSIFSVKSITRGMEIPSTY